MMDAVKRGADRQQLHERIRVHSMAASKVVKEEGGENDLLSRIAADSIFGVTLEELYAIVKPEKYVGRAPQQTEEFIDEVVGRAIAPYEFVPDEKTEINL
jgi:Adenylosuccinate lyase